MTRTALAAWASHPPMPHVTFGLRVQMPSYDAFEGRTGGGESGAGGSGGAAGGAAGAGAGGSGGAFKITNDSMVDFGDGKPVKWGEVVDRDGGRFMSADRFNRGLDYLKGEAAKLEKAWEKYHAGEGARPKQPDPNAGQHVDPMADIRDLAMVDGRTLEKLYKNLYAQGLAPIANMLAQTINDVKGLKEGFGKFSKTTGTLAEREANNDFERMITDSYGTVGDVKGLPEGAKLDAQSGFLRDLAKDVYLSHEQESWKAGEFPKALNSRIESMVAFVRSLDKQALDAAKDKRRTWINPNRGGARGTGTQKFKFQRGADVAKMFFEGAEGART